MTLLTSAQSAVVGDIAGQTFAGAKYATQVSSWRTDATKRVMLVHWVAEQRPCGAPSAARVSVATWRRYEPSGPRADACERHKPSARVGREHRHVPQLAHVRFLMILGV